MPLGDVKLKQVGDWLGRRDKSPTAVARAMSRYEKQSYGIDKYYFSFDELSATTYKCFLGSLSANASTS